MPQSKLHNNDEVGSRSGSMNNSNINFLTESTICSDCGKDFDSFQERFRHKRMCSNAPSNASSSSSMEKGIYRCLQCSMTFPKRNVLHRHLKMAHSNVKDVMCDVCGTAFKSKGTMVKHKKSVHLGEKKISCDLCDLKFFDMGTFRDDEYHRNLNL